MKREKVGVSFKGLFIFYRVLALTQKQYYLFFNKIERCTKILFCDNLVLILVSNHVRVKVVRDNLLLVRENFEIRCNEKLTKDEKCFFFYCHVATLLKLDSM